MDAKVTWKNGLSFTGTANSGFNVALGADLEVGGVNDGFRPLELMAVSLAGCTAMDVISLLRKKQQDVRLFEVQVQAPQAADFPKVFTQARITYLVTGHGVDETALRRCIELSASKYCPAQAMLGKIMPVELCYEIYEGESLEARTLAKSGTFSQ